MDFIKEADIVVVGGGVVGCAILRELSRYNVKCVLLEKEPDIACGTTKANSAILHAGFDAPTGSMKAITNVLGNRLYHQLEDELDLDIKWTGSLVVAVNDEEVETLKELLERGKNNGVQGLEILNREQVLKKNRTLPQLWLLCGHRAPVFAGRLKLRCVLHSVPFKTEQKLSVTAA